MSSPAWRARAVATREAAAVHLLITSPYAACGIFNYTSPTTTLNYTLNSCPMTFNEAESFCMARGAHLATYSNLEEQLDAEGYYIRLGGCQGCWH